MVFGNVASQYFQIKRLEYFQQQRSNPPSHFSKAKTLAIIGYPDKIDLHITNRIIAFAVVLETASLMG